MQIKDTFDPTSKKYVITLTEVKEEEEQKRSDVRVTTLFMQQNSGLFQNSKIKFNTKIIGKIPWILIKLH